jgi:nicotinamidase-related amidase
MTKSFMTFVEFFVNFFIEHYIKGSNKVGIVFFGNFDLITPNYGIQRIYIMGIIKIHCNIYTYIDSKIVENGPL